MGEIEERKRGRRRLRITGNIFSTDRGTKKVYIGFALYRVIYFV